MTAEHIPQNCTKLFVLFVVFVSLEVMVWHPFFSHVTVFGYLFESVVVMIGQVSRPYDGYYISLAFIVPHCILGTNVSKRPTS